ncbi:pectinesterase family protein [Mucilaginibacter terrae]|uniref:Pectinesterase n=1 Tax=Mucilaginibacter terrae TaxID=1955052 RepID=A0ABU3GPC4_9SPHI|nr:pectinesterase family protein [Mucilaginibacter terrae]MDT3401381.1 pectinesterase [Mucilaginibacter terrae]
MTKLKYILFAMLLLGGVKVAEAKKRWVVAQDGSGDFKTVQEAINASPENSAETTEVFIKKGKYKERIEVKETKINLTLIGEDVMNTIITYDNYASKLDSAGKPLGTRRTASFYVYAKGLTAKNISFENSSGPVGQAVAVFVTGDHAAFFNCRFLGFQDTLYTHGPGSTQYYYKCYIEGTTDFIFGAATALFEDCKLFGKKGGFYFTAASTEETAKYGYIFLNCDISGDAPANSYALGRPWRPHAKVVFKECNLSNIISPSGWDNWRNPENEKTAYYAEYKNTGPGFQPESRVSWSHQLTDEEAKLYTKKLVLAGWEPQQP